jgi:hypothetical protein
LGIDYSIRLTGAEITLETDLLESPILDQDGVSVQQGSIEIS